ncbi:MAG TPA: hypothetical protein PK431_16315, partial [Chitinophagales bacterium]|nr:hypothetical protein [Chitinophagales bacterium]
MKKLLLLTFLFTSFLCEAQQKLPVIEWQKTIGGRDDDILQSMQQTIDGGYVVGGISRSNISNEKAEVSRGEVDYWIVKLDKIGGITWQKTIGGLNYDQLSCVRQTTDSGYILGGTSQSNISGEKSENSRGGNDYWILKLTSTGTIVWQKTIGGLNADNLTSIQQTADGGYIVGGDSESGISGDKTENSRGGQDYWILKLSSNGTIQWQKTIGGTNSDVINNIRQTIDGGYILGGTSISNISGEKTDTCRGNNDYWILKLNSSGTIVWQKTIGGSKVDDLGDIQQTIDGGYILGGTSNSFISGEKTENSRYEDYWVVKLNGAGTMEWQKTIGGTLYEKLYHVQQTPDGGYLLGGDSDSNISGDKIENCWGTGGYADYWPVKINSIGNIIWQKTIGGIYNDYMYGGIQQTSDSEYILSGSSKSIISGNKTESYRGVNGNPDYWILKLKVVENPDSIIGKVFQSQNTNCTKEANEKGISNIIINTDPKSFYGISDTSGKYAILTDTGVYKVRQITSIFLKPFLQGFACPSIGYHTVSFSQYGQDTSEINFANYEKQCAYLQLELAQGRMRRCFNNTTAIKYCNIGNVDTTNVQVIVTLPEYVTFVSASNPNYTIVGKKITFNIGNLRANECGTINLITKVDCVNGIVGLTQCISAYILPRNKCVDQIQPDYSLWDKSEVAVEGRCTGNTARFVIKNTGQNNMTDSSSYRIYKDAVQAVNKKFKLNAGDSLVINVTALGFTYRLEADQVPHFPSASLPSITIENCGTGTASRGFVNQMPQNTVAPDVEKICLPIRDSYDPNDKQVSPSGVGTG